MATCKQCLHYDVCGGYLPSDLDKDVFDYLREGRGDEIPDIDERCGSFKRKSDFVKLPCKIGDTVWDAEGNAWKVIAITIWRDCIGLKTANDRDVRKTFTIGKRSIGKTIFLSIE